MEGDQTATEGEGDKLPQATLRELLLATNLTAYEEALRQHGADDVEQLKHLEDNLFDSLCQVVGLKSKPFHLLRFEKALNRNASRFSLETRQETCSESASEGAFLAGVAAAPGTTLTGSGVSPTSRISPPSGRSGGLSRLLSPLPTPQSLPSTIGHSERGNGSTRGPVVRVDTLMGGELSDSQGSDQLEDKNVFCLPAYLHPKANTSDFSQLVDDATPIQQSLGLSPISAHIWDLKRANLIRYAAAIYGRKVNSRKSGELTSHETNVNEAAAQLCLRDPTLLIRREELFLLARRAVREGGFSYVHGFSRSKHGNTACAGAQESSANGTPQQGSVSEEPKSVRERRKQRLEELQVLITRNKDEQHTKMAALNQAQESRNFSQAYQLQTDIEALGNVCLTLETEFNQLKRRQKRSDRYFESKAKRPAPKEESPSSECQPKRFSSSDLTAAAVIPLPDDITTSHLSIRPEGSLPARSEDGTLPCGSIQPSAQPKHQGESVISVAHLHRSSASLQASHQTASTSAPSAKTGCSPRNSDSGSVVVADDDPELTKPGGAPLEGIHFLPMSEGKQQKSQRNLPLARNSPSSSLVSGGIMSPHPPFPLNGQLLQSPGSSPLSRDHSVLPERILLSPSLSYGGTLLQPQSAPIRVSSTLVAANVARPSGFQYTAIPANLLHPLATAARSSKRAQNDSGALTSVSAHLIKPSANVMVPSSPSPGEVPVVELPAPLSSLSSATPSELLASRNANSTGLGSSEGHYFRENGKSSLAKPDHYAYQTAPPRPSHGHAGSGLYVEDFFTLPSSS